MKKSDHLPDMQTEIESFHSMLEALVIAAQLQMSALVKVISICCI